MRVTSEQLTAWRALEQQATPGPWRVYRCSEIADHDDDDACGIKSEPFVSEQEDAYQRGVVIDTSRDECHHALTTGNAAFIAAARTAIPALLQLVEELEKERDGMRAVVDAATELRNQPMLVKGDNATWGDVALAENTGPKLLGALIHAVDAYRKAKP